MVDSPAVALRTATTIVVFLAFAPGCGGPLRTPCNDGLDNDGDGLVDSADVGCELSRGTTETPAPQQPVPAPPEPTPDDVPDDSGDAGADAGAEDELPACADGLDNDGDGSRDFPDDPGCESPDDDDEIDDLSRTCGPLVPVRSLGADGTALGRLDAESPIASQLASATCGGQGGELAYRFVLADGPATLEITTDHPETTLDTVVYLRTICLDPLAELACSDDGGAAAFGKSSTVVVNGALPGEYIVVVDSFSPASLGTFKLSVTAR